MAWNAPSGLSNCLRSFAYCTVISRARSAPPIASAARRMMPSCITASKCFQPVPAAPMRSAAATRTSARSTWYCVSDARLRCWVSVTPAARGSTRKRSTASGASPVRASTTSRVAADAKSTWRFVPESAEPVAVGLRTELDARRAEAAARLEPGRRQDRLARGDARKPARASAPRSRPRARRPARDHGAETKCGEGASERPNSSYTIAASSADCADPPYSSGIRRPVSPSSPSCFHSSAG